jgi:quinohemoprotein ethanol dehydrogenase
MSRRFSTGDKGANSMEALKAGLVCVGVLLTLGVGAATGQSLADAPTKFGQIDDARMRNAGSEPQNWLVNGGNQQSWRYSALDQITPDNIKDLKPAWVLDFDTTRGQEATPIVVDGVAYVSTAWSNVYAVNARTGEKIWEWQANNAPDSGAKPCCDVVNRGVAVYKGKVYVGTIDGRLVALDARTGKEVWSTQTLPEDTFLSSTGAPRVGAGLVVIGNSGGDIGGRGFVSAYDAETGKKVWRFFLTPGEPGVKDNEISDEIMDTIVQPTWFGPSNEYRGGATVWGSIVYDREFDQFLFATGNGFPWSRYWRSEGKGDNLFLASIVALDARTGRYKWHYQETPGEEWDYAATADMTLAELPIKGKMTKVVMHAPKSGVFFILDRETGKLASGAPFVPGLFWFKGFNPDGTVIVNDEAHYSPGHPSGSNGFARNWFPMSWDPNSRLMYMQASQSPPGVNYATDSFEWRKAGTSIGIYVFGQAIPEELRKIPVPRPANPVPRKSYLMAWDPVKQQAAWRTDGYGNGVLATAGNLVFQGASRNVMGTLNAFRADTGEKIWSYDTPNAILTGPVSYMIDGEQYILAPMGAALGIMGGGRDARAPQVGRLVAFKLNGKATLPPDPPAARPILAPPASETWTEAHLFEGSQIYANYCAHCHGVNTNNNNVIPDLKRSPYMNSAEAWKAVVIDGGLAQAGMISWADYISTDEAETIRNYVQSQARKALANPPDQNGQPMQSLTPTEAATQ